MDLLLRIHVPILPLFGFRFAFGKHTGLPSIHLASSADWGRLGNLPQAVRVFLRCKSSSLGFISTRSPRYHVITFLSSRVDRHHVYYILYVFTSDAALYSVLLIMYVL